MKRDSMYRRRGLHRWLAAAGAAALLLTLHPLAANAQMALRRDLVIDGDFGFVTAIAVDRQGRVYVADDQMQQLLAFDASGAPLRQVGGRGGGPGEFLGLQSLVVARGDTLYAFDANQRRITAFAPGADRKVAYTVSVQALSGELPSLQLLVPSRGPFLLSFTTPFSAARAQPGAPEGARGLTLRAVDRRGRPSARPVLRSPDRDAMVTRRGQSVSVGPMPYGRSPFFLLGPGDRLYYGWNASPDVSAFDLQGHRLGTVRTGAAPLPVSGADMEALEASYPRDSQELVNLRMALREGRVPRTRPAFKGMMMDDNGRLWVNVSTVDDVVVLGGAGLTYAPARASGDRGGVTPWWVFDPSGRRVAVHTVPSSVRLSEVRGGKAYGIDVDEDGVQRVVRYVVAR